MKNNRMLLLLPTLLLGGASYATAGLQGPTAASLFGAELGDTRVLSSHATEHASGYRVESGNLINSKGSPAGAVVWVTAPDGGVTAFIDREEKRGILQIDALGSQTFSADENLAFPDHDALSAFEQSEPSDTPAAAGTTYIDSLVGFTAEALAARAVDPKAFALGQMEWVNLSLRNSGVWNIELRLAGIRITDEKIPVTTAGLSTWQTQLDAQRAQYQHDINVGFSVGGDAGGWAWRPGRTSVNSIHGTSPFKHEMGHNVGGAHCYPNAGDNYKHGHNAGDGFTTNLCGNSRPYYSTPHVTVDGKVIGNAKTADMVRLWREQAGRLSGYSPAFPGERMIYTSRQPFEELSIRFSTARGKAGVVALSPDVGPTSLTYGGAGVTLLTVKLAATDGKLHPVKVRAQRTVNGCEQATTMNSYQICHPDAGAGMKLTLSYHAEDNLELAPGWYNGTVELKALDTTDANWSLPILVTLAVQR